MLFFYCLYRLAQFLAMYLPLNISYKLAVFSADVKYYFSKTDRNSVKSNLRLILGKEPFEIDRLAKEVFRNFGRYLVDFFRFPKIDSEYIDANVEISGIENVREALLLKKGAVMVSSHIGNWELGGAVFAIMGNPLAAVVVNHKYEKINELFINQRLSKGIDVIPLGGAFKKCLGALSKNKGVAVLGDVDFSGHGIKTKFFNKITKIPKGPAMLSLITGAPIIPCFMIRKNSYKYQFFFEKSISYKPTGKIDFDVTYITKKVVEIMETYIRKYPSQWLIFREFWSEPGEVI